MGFSRRQRALQRGASYAEYLIVLVMVAVAAMAGFRLFGTKVGEKVACQGNALAGMNGSACDDGDPGTGTAPPIAVAAGAVDVAAPPPPPSGGAWDGLGEALAASTTPKASPDGKALCFGGACLHGACFVAGTGVTTPGGLTSIDTLEEGEIVLSRDERTGDSAWRRVARVVVTEDREVLDLEIDGDESGAETLGVTPEHPFWSAERGWVSAVDLEPGELLETASGQRLHVVGLSVRAERETVYNLEVEGFHTYFVGPAGAWVHNECPPAEDPLRRMLQMEPYLKIGSGPSWDALHKIRQGDHRYMTLPEVPKGAPPSLAASLEGLKKKIKDADAAMKKARDAYTAWAEPRTKWERTSGGSIGHIDWNDEGRALSEADDRAVREVHDALVKYVAAIDAARRGGGMEFDGGGRPNKVHYPSGASISVERDGADITRVTYTAPNGTTTSVYRAGERGVFRTDTGKGKDDPVAFKGGYAMEPDGTLVRTADNRRITLTPEGKTSVKWTKPDAFEMKTDIGGGLVVRVTRAEDGIAMSVKSGDAGMRSTVIRMPFEVDREVNPKIIKTEGDVILLSLDASDTPHVAVSAKLSPWGEGARFSDRMVPYYEAGKLNLMLKHLPSGTKALDVEIVTATSQARHTWVTPLPADKGYVLPPRWTPSQMGTWRGSGEPRFGWNGPYGFVADTSSSDRKFARFVEDYMTSMTRGAPVVGTVVMAGEAIVGVEMNGRAMSPKERVVHGAFAALGAVLEFGPAAMSAAQTSRALTQIQKASGVTRSEAQALLAEARAMNAEERALLKLAAEGKPVDASKLTPLVLRMESAMAKVRGAAPLDAAGAVAKAEAAMARPSVSPAMIEQMRKARAWADELATGAKVDPAQVAEEATKFAARRDQIKKAYDLVMSGKAAPPPGVTRERLAMAVEGAADGQRIPLNFKDRTQFDRFQRELREVFESEGIFDATVNQVGSATQGWKGNPKKPPPFGADGALDPKAYWSSASDLDFAVFSDQALAQARAAGAPVNTNVVVGGKYTVLKNGGGVSNTTLGQKLEAFAQKWNAEFYGDAARAPGFEGIDFKLNLSNQPFSTAPTIIKPSVRVEGLGPVTGVLTPATGLPFNAGAIGPELTWDARD